MTRVERTGGVTPANVPTPSEGKGKKRVSARDVDLQEPARVSWTSKVARDHGRLGPYTEIFAKHWAAKPSLEEGETKFTFTHEELQVLHDYFWRDAPPEWDTKDLHAALVKLPLFRGRKKTLTPKMLTRIWSSFPESFPWGWNGRRVMACSHLLIDTLMQTPAGTPLKDVVDALEKSHPGFPGAQVAHGWPRDKWPSDPKRFPFAKVLPTENGDYVLRAMRQVAVSHQAGRQGATTEAGRLVDSGIQYDSRGNLRSTEGLAYLVMKLADDPRVQWDWEAPQFYDMVNSGLAEGGFTKNHLQRVRERYNGKSIRVVDGETGEPRDVRLDVPDFITLRERAQKRLFEKAIEIHEGGENQTSEICRRLHEDFGLAEIDVPALNNLKRKFDPEGTVQFRGSAIAEREEKARGFLEAIKANRKKTFVQVARGMGIDAREQARLTFVIRSRWPDELPSEPRFTYTAAEKKILQQVIDDAPLNATGTGLLNVLRSEHPEFLERHPYSDYNAVLAALSSQLGIDSWPSYRQQRYTRLFVDVVAPTDKKTGERKLGVELGTSLAELARHMQNEYDGAYCEAIVGSLARQWKRHPEKSPPVGELIDERGKFPWQYHTTPLTAELAQQVADTIRENPGHLLSWYVNKLKRRTAFREEYPTFTTNTVQTLARKFPGIVPYLDDLNVRSRRNKQKEHRIALRKLAERVAVAADKVEDKAGLTNGFLARKLRTKVHRVRNAIIAFPELFPWYRRQPSGNIDRALALRVARVIEEAPLGTTRDAIIRQVKNQPGVADAYPALSVNTLSTLRSRFPDLVPRLDVREQVLRSQTLVDALLSARRGTRFETVIKKLQAAHPGGFFDHQYSDPETYDELWATYPERFPFANELRNPRGLIRWEGHGLTPPARDETVTELASKLARIEGIPDELPLLDKLVDELAPQTFNNFEVLAVQHVLDSQVPAFEAYRRVGIKPSRTTIVGLPYSTNDDVVELMQDNGWDVRTPPLDIETWKDEVRDALRERLEAALDHPGRQVLVLDDGGLVAKLLSEDEFAEHAHLFKIVEQHRRGVKVADRANLNVPVVNVGQSVAMDLAAPMVADSVREQLTERLERIGVESVRGMRIGLAGFDTDGRQLAELLRDMGAHVTVRDSDPKRAAKAARGGFDTGDSREDFFGGQDMILGT